MTTKQRLESSLRDAMRSGNEVEKRTIRMALSNIKFEEINKGNALDETGISALLQKEIKIRREAIEDAIKANRMDLVKENEAEIKVIEHFLPKQLTEEELRSLIIELVKETQVSGLADMGKVMKLALARVQGRAPNDLVSRIVRQVLSG